jgi:hypothetical protein
MTTNSRPSYKEAQERLLKWCQNVTSNYEVSSKLFLIRFSFVFDLINSQ